MTKLRLVWDISVWVCLLCAVLGLAMLVDVPVP